MEYRNCAKDAERSWNEMASVQFDKYVWNRNVNGNELSERPFDDLSTVPKILIFLGR
jgi:hypothetical protein